MKQMGGWFCWVPVALWHPCCLSLPPTPTSASQKNHFLTFIPPGSFFRWLVNCSDLDLWHPWCLKAEAQHVDSTLSSWEEGEDSSAAGATGSRVSSSCLVGTPGVSILGNVGVSFLIIYQGVEIVMWIFFFFFMINESSKSQKKEREDIWGPHTYRKSADCLFLKRWSREKFLYTFWLIN